MKRNIINAVDFISVIEGKQTRLYSLKNKNGLSASFCNYGARWVSFCVPDQQGNVDDIVLGFNSIQDYLKAEEPYHGAIIGRVAGRIRQGQIQIGSAVFQLSINERHSDDFGNHLHGGEKGFSFRVWDSEMKINEKGEEMVLFHYLSPDGEEGYPGNLKVTVMYTLTNNDSVTMECVATTDKATPISLTNHAYFNLNGGNGQNILDHFLKISAGKCFEFDPKDFCVTGRILEVRSTPLNFLTPKKIGENIQEGHSQLMEGKGYNSFYILEKVGEFSQLPSAVLWDQKTCRRLEIFTSEPGLQLYCAGYWKGEDVGKEGKLYPQFGGVALEAHQYPYVSNGNFLPTKLLLPHQEYRQVTEYRFSVSES